MRTTTIASGTALTIRQTIGVVTSTGCVSSRYVTETMRADAQPMTSSSGNSIAMRAARMRSAWRVVSNA